MDSLLEVLQAALERRRRGWAWVGFVTAALMLIGVVITAPIVVERIETERAQRQQAESERDESYHERGRQLLTAEALRATAMAKDPSRATDAVWLALTTYARQSTMQEAVRVAAKIDETVRTELQAPIPEIDMAMYATTRRLHHSFPLTSRSEILCAAFAPDSSLVATGGNEGIQLWDPLTGELRHELQALNRPVEALEFSPDARLLWSMDDREITLWYVDDGHRVATFNEGRPRAAAFAPDGRTLAVGDDMGIVTLHALSDSTTPLVEPPHTLPLGDSGQPIQDLGFTADARLVVLRRERVDLHTLDTAMAISMPLPRSEPDIRLSLAGDQGRASFAKRQIALSPDVTILASPGRGGTIELNNTSNGERIGTLDTRQGQITRLVFAPKGPLRLASAGEEGAPKIWDPRSGTLEATLEGHHDLTRDIAFSADAATLISVGFDHTLRIADANNGRLRETIMAEAGMLGGVAVANNGREVVVLGSDAARVWSMNRLSEASIAQLPDRARVAAFSPDASRVVIGERGGPVRIWNTATGEQLPLRASNVTALTWGPDGEQIAAAGKDLRVRLFGADGMLMHQCGVHQAFVTAIAFSADAKLLASADIEGEVMIWQADSGELLHRRKADPAGVTALAFDPQGVLAIAGLSKTIELWQPGSARTTNVPVQNQQVYALAFTPRGHLVFAGEYTDVQIWDGREVLHLKDQAARIETLSVTRDGLLVVGAESEVRLWELDSRRLRARFGHFRDPEAAILAVALTADGERALAVSTSGEISSSLASQRARLQIACEVLVSTRAGQVPLCGEILD